MLPANFLGAGYSLTRWAWPDKTERLVQDLTLADHLDEYLEVGTFEFLTELAESPIRSGIRNSVAVPESTARRSPAIVRIGDDT